MQNLNAVQDLPGGWLQQYDPICDAWFYVNTNVIPPRSTWLHPLRYCIYPPPPGTPPLENRAHLQDRSLQSVPDPRHSGDQDNILQQHIGGPVPSIHVSYGPAASFMSTYTHDSTQHAFTASNDLSYPTILPPGSNHMLASTSPMVWNHTQICAYTVIADECHTVDCGRVQSYPKLSCRSI
ncbi:hypothetical protein OBBRIDRAFT_647941 [Obba rivulosa]|uniref:WW domain-containing protein n=1 Tax=Obba rivulosa TaxID=1052685 RepID=A0A8E2DT59_9APHY|nr:hypothetical protein OBBRIDRAFT_647941 [Obba rivulosa]